MLLDGSSSGRTTNRPDQQTGRDPMYDNNQEHGMADYMKKQGAGL